MSDIPESAFQKRITDFCDWLGLRWYHSSDSRRDNPGFPDLVIVGPGGVIFAELKTRTGKVRPAQEHWHLSLLAAGQKAFIWRPDDWDEIQVKLRSISVRHNVFERRSHASE